MTASAGQNDSMLTEAVPCHGDNVSHPFPITALSPNASMADAWKIHWREYGMEAAQLAVLMFFICLSASLLYGRRSPLHDLTSLLLAKSLLMGLAVAAGTYGIIRSPFGRRTGAHFNPAVTLTYFYLGKVHRWDALFYVICQFIGGILGVCAALLLLRDNLSQPPVCYAITLPGQLGSIVALIAEFSLSGLLIAVILFTSNHRVLSRFSPLAVAALTVLYYGFGAPISGFSVNPARSFSSALFASIWRGLWIYFIAPIGGMIFASAIYAKFVGKANIYCAKVFHDMRSSCPFRCRFTSLYSTRD